MKKVILPIVLFLLAFVLTYIGSCYLVPGWRIKLAADSRTYFLKSLKTLVPMKLLVSFLAGLMAGLVSAGIQKIKSNTEGKE